MATQSLADSITMQHGALDSRFLLDLKAEQPSAGISSWIRRAKRMDSLALRIALPPLAIWGTLYSLVEYLV